MPLAAVLGALAIGSTAANGALGYDVLKTNSVTYHVVTADLASRKLSPRTVASERLTSVWNLISKSEASAAITGTFFAPKAQRPVADVLIDGLLVSKGSLGTAVGVTWNGDVEIFDRPTGQPVDWGNYRYGLRGAVRLVRGGVVCPDPKSQSFKDSRLWSRAARTGLGVTSRGKLVMIATKSNVTLSEMGAAMLQRGVREAVSLDGGSSTCLYFNGSLVVAPGRQLCNLFVVALGNPLEWNGPGNRL